MEIMKDRDFEDNPMLINSTPEQISSFRQSTFWGDMKRELEIWIDMARGMLENPDSSPAEDSVNKGRIDAVRYVLEMPRVLQGTKKEELERSQYERENKEG